MKTCNAQHRTSNVQDFKKSFGEEYPAAVVQDGIRMPLKRESRFARSYHSDEHKTCCTISRFMDHSASITASELKQAWATWPKDLQLDFCLSCNWLFPQDDYPEMLRFIMQDGKSDHWSAIALNVASELPQQEAFDVLCRALHKTDISRATNLVQGIASTKHPSTEPVLREHLAALWSHPVLWNDADFLNWAAFGATTCIAHLIKLGAPAADFVEQTRQLSRHACLHNRDSCRRYLSKHYPQINFQN